MVIQLESVKAKNADVEAMRIVEAYVRRTMRAKVMSLFLWPLQLTPDQFLKKLELHSALQKTN